MMKQPHTKTSFDLSGRIESNDNVVLTRATSCKFLGITLPEEVNF